MNIEDLLDNRRQGRGSAWTALATFVPDGVCWKCCQQPEAEGFSACGSCLRWMRGEDVLAIGPQAVAPQP